MKKKDSMYQRTERKNYNTNNPKKLSQLLHTKEQFIKNTFDKLRTQNLEDKRDIIYLGKQIEDQMNIIIE